MRKRAAALWHQGRGWAVSAGVPLERWENGFRQQAMPRMLKLVAVRLIGFVRRTGLKIVELEPGRVVCEMPLKGNTNHIGTMYAGALFTLAEFPGGALFVATFDWRRFVPIVTDVKLQFIRPVRTSLRFEMALDADEISRIEKALQTEGRAGFVFAGELTAPDGTVVARSQASYQIRPKA